MPTFVVFSQERGPERIWVSDDEVEWWQRLCARSGWPTVRLETYKRRGFFPITDDEWGVTLRPNPQRTRR